MSKKSTPRRQSREERLAALQPGIPMVYNARGEPTRTEIFRRYAEVLITDDYTIDKIENILNFAAAAWNLALTPPHSRPNVLAGILKEAPITLQPSLRDELTFMVERKEREYAQYTWWVDHLDISECPTGYALTLHALVTADDPNYDEL